jgi:hypothetical protein
MKQFTELQIVQRRGARMLAKRAMRLFRLAQMVRRDKPALYALRRDAAKQLVREACSLAFLAHPELRES